MPPYTVCFPLGFRGSVTKLRLPFPRVNSVLVGGGGLGHSPPKILARLLPSKYPQWLLPPKIPVLGLLFLHLENKKYVSVLSLFGIITPVFYLKFKRPLTPQWKGYNGNILEFLIWRQRPSYLKLCLPPKNFGILLVTQWAKIMNIHTNHCWKTLTKVY